MNLKNLYTSTLFDRIITFNDSQKCLTGKLFSEINSKKGSISNLSEVEFKVFSQWGDDGIIQFLINKIEIKNKIFVEFGVETYHESNTRFLLMNDNWTGLVIDGSEKNIKSIKNQKIYWEYELNAICSFITKDNINNLISSAGIHGEIGLLSVDIDGNDFWVLNEINVINPIIIIVEYNAVFGNDTYITIPYDPTFVRKQKHYSHLYWGASLGAFYHLLEAKGYSFIGCNSNGNNGYFVRKDKIGDLPVFYFPDGFVDSKFSESRDINGKLTYARGKERNIIVKGLQVIDVRTGENIPL